MQVCVPPEQLSVATRRFLPQVGHRPTESGRSSGSIGDSLVTMSKLA